MADLYRRKVGELAEALAHEESRAGAAESLRGLIDGITLTPDGGELRIELQGNLAAMLRAAEAQRSGRSSLVGGVLNDGPRSPSNDDLVQIMVAGAGFEPATLGYEPKSRARGPTPRAAGKT